MAAATTSSPKTSPHRPNGMFEVTIKLARSEQLRVRPQLRRAVGNGTELSTPLEN